MAEAKGSRNKVYALLVVALLAVVSILYYVSAPVYLYIVAYMWFGFLYGVLQQYGRFCFASAWRDLIMIRVPRMFVGIMIGMMTLSIIAVFIFTYYPERYHTALLGFHGLIGGMLFGLGMVFAGGCATGSLYKTGEGNMISLTVLLTLSFSQAIFAVTLFDSIFDAFIKNMPKFSMTEILFGKPPEGVPYDYNYYSFWQHFVADALINAILVAMVLLIGVYFIVVRKGFLKKRTAELAATADGGEAKTGLKDDVAGFWSMIVSSKRTAIAAVLIGLVAAGQVFGLGWMAQKYDFVNFGNVLVAQPTPYPDDSEEAHAPPQAYDAVNGECPDMPANYTATDDGKCVPSTWPAKTYPNDVAVRSGNTVFDPGYWYITTQEAMFAGWTMEKAGVSKQTMTDNNYFGNFNGLPRPWHSPALLLSIGLILGASFLSLWNREFKWKFPSRELFVYAVIGGTLMGVGARVALGCNIGAFYAPAAFGDPSGWVFFVGMGVGAYFSAKIVNWWANRKMADMDFDIDIEI